MLQGQEQALHLQVLQVQFAQVLAAHLERHPADLLPALCLLLRLVGQRQCGRRGGPHPSRPHLHGVLLELRRGAEYRCQIRLQHDLEAPRNELRESAQAAQRPDLDRRHRS